MKYVLRKKLYIIIAYIIDIVGSIVAFPIKIFAKILPEKFCKILVIRVDHIGDVISAVSVLEPLRERFPESTIDFMVPLNVIDIFEKNQYINNLIMFEAPWFNEEKKGPVQQLKGIYRMRGLIKGGSYDLVIDLRGDMRHIIAMFLAGVRHRIGYGITGGSFLLTHVLPYKGIMHEGERNMELLQPLGIKSPVSNITLDFSEADCLKANSLLSEFGVKQEYAIVHPIPRHFQKSWNIDSFAKVIQYVCDEKKLLPVIIGTIHDKFEIKKIIDKIRINIIDISGKTSLGVLGVILKGAKLFIGVDSGPSHIAAALGIPTIILFSGVNDPEIWAPKGDNVKIIYPGRGKDLSLLMSEEVCDIIERVLQCCKLKV